MTCSVGFRAPSHADMLRDFSEFLAEQLSEEIRYADPDLVPQANPGEISSGAVKESPACSDSVSRRFRQTGRMVWTLYDLSEIS